MLQFLFLLLFVSCSSTSYEHSKHVYDKTLTYHTHTRTGRINGRFFFGAEIQKHNTPLSSRSTSAQTHTHTRTHNAHTFLASSLRLDVKKRALRVLYNETFTHDTCRVQSIYDIICMTLPTSMLMPNVRGESHLHDTTDHDLVMLIIQPIQQYNHNRYRYSSVALYTR